MKRMKKIPMIGFVILMFAWIFSSCAVSNPTADDIFPIMKAGVVQLFIIGQPTRWGPLTNANTPYTIQSFATVTNDTMTNATANLDLTKSGTYSYTLNLNMGLLVKTNTGLPALFSNLTEVPYTNETETNSTNKTNYNYYYLPCADFAEFKTGFSNVESVIMSGTLYYTNGGLSLTTVFSNIHPISESGVSMFTNGLNNISAFTNDINYMKMQGAVNGTNFTITIQKGLTASFSGSQSNSYENIAGGYSAFVSLDVYNYWHKVTYNSTPDFIAIIDSIEKYTDKVNVNLTNGN